MHAASEQFSFRIYGQKRVMEVATYLLEKIYLQDVSLLFLHNVLSQSQNCCCWDTLARYTPLGLFDHIFMVCFSEKVSGKESGLSRKSLKFF